MEKKILIDTYLGCVPAGDRMRIQEFFETFAGLKTERNTHEFDISFIETFKEMSTGRMGFIVDDQYQVIDCKIKTINKKFASNVQSYTDIGVPNIISGTRTSSKIHKYIWEVVLDVPNSYKPADGIIKEEIRVRDLMLMNRLQAFDPVTFRVKNRPTIDINVTKVVTDNMYAYYTLLL